MEILARLITVSKLETTTELEPLCTMSVMMASNWWALAREYVSLMGYGAVSCQHANGQVNSPALEVSTLQQFKGYCNQPTISSVAVTIPGL